MAFVDKGVVWEVHCLALGVSLLQSDEHVGVCGLLAGDGESQVQFGASGDLGRFWEFDRVDE